MREKDAPYELCLEVLKRLDKTGVLQDVVLIGSWCIYFYKDHFQQTNYVSTLRTRDVDFLIPAPTKIKAHVDLQHLLKELGFILDWSSEGYSRLVHPELIVDCIVPEVGAGLSRPYPIKALGISAQPLRFVNLLVSDTILVKSHGLTLRLPHPLSFAFQKLIVSGRRKSPEKKEKDRQQAIQILDLAMKTGEELKARQIFRSLPPRWKSAILKSLKEADTNNLITALQ